jgi:protein TonB
VDLGTEDPVFPSRRVPAIPFVARFRTGAGRRALGLALAILIEILLVIALLTLGREAHPGLKDDRPTVITFIAPETPEEPPKPPTPEPERRAEARPEAQRPQPEQPHPPSPTPPSAAPPAPAIIPMQFQLAPGAPRITESAAPAVRHVVTAYGDSERVGTAPNGEPLYGAEWYREPDRHMLGTYLSTAHGPGWGLIACRTAPDYRVEDCVPLEEYPHGSEINRSVLAAAWEFRVRPPRRGGEPLVGSWVRIRIDYDLRH